MNNKMEGKEKPIKPEESSGFLLQLTWAKLRSWLGEICPYGKLDDYCQVMANDTPLGLMKVRVFTHDYRYSIFAKKQDDGASLICTASRRKPLAGLTDHTYAVLVDDNFSRATWERIKSAILRFELVKLTARAKEAKEEKWRKESSHYELHGKQYYDEWLQKGDQISEHKTYELVGEKEEGQAVMERSAKKPE